MLNTKNRLQTPRENELKFYKLLRNYIDLSYKKVQMRFTHDDNDYKHLLYWGQQFLNNNGVDAIYTLYLLLEPQLLEETTNLNGTF